MSSAPRPEVRNWSLTAHELGPHPLSAQVPRLVERPVFVQVCNNICFVIQEELANIAASESLKAATNLRTIRFRV
jgi:hypothetical protein